MKLGQYKRIAFSLATGGLVAVGLLLLLDGTSQEVRADPGMRFVSTGGADSGDCSDSVNPCRTVQYAVDAASDGDTIKVATGVYTDIHARAGVTQVVYINKSVTIRGGYTTSNWTVSDPVANPTTLDAQGQGRVLYITGDINPTVEGLRITGGDAYGLGGYTYWAWGTIDAGGGIYIIGATAIISNNQVFSNTANIGSGLFLWWSDVTLSGNTIFSNTAAYCGGGLGLMNSDATLSGNTVTTNTADFGGGLYISMYSDATLSGNTVTSNSADYGGGL